MPFEKGNKLGFQPGKSGNPSGRPKGFAQVAQRCREVIENGGIEFFVNVANGEPIEETVVRKNKFVKQMRYPTVLERAEAYRFLWDRGFGKAVQTNRMVGGDETDPSGEDVGEQARKRLMARRAAEKANGDPKLNGGSDEVSRLQQKDDEKESG